MKKFLHTVYFSFAVLLIIFAVLVSVMRFLTPIAKRYQPDIETWASHTLGKTVVIGDINTGWHNLSPVIELANINVSGSHINSVRISIAVLRTLWHRQLIFKQLIFDGMHLDIVQDAHNNWQITGLSTPIMPSVDPNKPVVPSQTNPALIWLLSQPELAIQNFSANIKVNNYPSHVIHNLKLILHNSGNKHYLRGQIIFNEEQHSSVDVAANIVGSATDVADITAKIYFSGNKLRLVNWLGTDDYYGFHVTKGMLSFQLWGDWHQQRLNSVHSTFNLQNLQLQALADPTMINVQHFSGNTLWQTNQTGWQMTADDVQLTINKHVWPTNKIGVFVTRKDNVDQQSAQINFLQLSDLTPFLTHITLINPAIQKKIKNYDPQGQIRNIQMIRLINQGKLTDFTHFHVVAALQNIGVDRAGNAPDDLPGVKNLTANLNLDANQGSIQINSVDTTLDFGRLFHQPLTLQKLTGTVQWQQGTQGITIQGSQLDLEHPNMSLQSNFSLLVPNTGSPNPSSSICLLAQFKETDLSKITQFLPISILAPSVVQWLDQAFVSGDGAQGSMVLMGALNKFPYLHGEGQFTVRSLLKNIKLNFAPGWPTINNLNGELTFNKQAMFFKLQQADLYQLPIKHLTAQIPDLGQYPQAYLYINSNLDLPNTAVAEDFVFHSPLRDSVGKSLAGINLQGKGELLLKLKIPLTSGDTITNGQLNLRANTLAIPSLNLNFTQLTGLINFTDLGLSSPLLMANFFQQPLTLSIKPMRSHGERITVFDINSILDMNTVQHYFAPPLSTSNKLDFLTGTTQFRARLTLNSKNDALLKINTDLQGVKINLPAPFGKTIEATAPFAIDVKIKSGNAPIIKMSYEKLWQLFLGYQKIDKQNTLEKVLIHFGPGIDTLPTQSGIYINGILKNFDWDTWQPIFQTYIFAKKASTAVEVVKPELRPLQLKDINLFVDRITGFKQVVDQAQVHVKHDATSWLIELISAQIDGQLNVPFDATQPMVGNFKTLYLRALTEGAGGDVKKFDPKQMISINIHADDFHYGTQNFGAVTLQAQPIAQGMKIQTLSIHNADLSLDTQGTWTRIANQDHSNFTGILKTNNLGKLLHQQAITDDIQDGKGQVEFTVSWSASPADLAPKTLMGNVTLNFTSGAIIGLSKATNEKIGLGRVLNALSLRNIYDRLTFQNKNIDTDGFSFNEMKGTLTFKNGDIFTSDGYINGQVAQIFMNGSVSLRSENFDLLIKVIPYLTSSLPIIATIAGGPIIGAITWAADKVVTVGIEKTVIYQYRITGPWADPIVAEAK
ncbi:MAG: TIGR02099 family protein [Gammaproteobacteria bacterium]|nr:TIGR02099 family protein [Gammaproteobacteria bacterium]